MNPNVDRKGVEQSRTSMTKALAMILAMMPALALDGDEHEVPQLKPSPIDIQKPQQEKSPRYTPEEIKAKERLTALLAVLKSSEHREGSPMLDPGVGLKEGCRVASDWMIHNAGDLDHVWRNLYERKDAWPAYLKDDFDKMINDTKSLPGAAGTLEQFDEKTRKRLVEKQAFKCGIGVSIASWFLSMKDLQERGFTMTEHIAQFFIDEMGNSDPLIKTKATESVSVMIRIAESISALKQKPR